jgi:hypothetical protein
VIDGVLLVLDRWSMGYGSCVGFGGEIDSRVVNNRGIVVVGCRWAYEFFCRMLLSGYKRAGVVVLSVAVARYLFEVLFQERRCALGLLMCDVVCNSW